jgi:hypothetical protein
MLIANDVFDHAMHDQLVKATEANAAVQEAVNAQLHQTKSKTDGTISTTTATLALLAAPGAVFGILFAVAIGAASRAPSRR